MSNAVEPMVYTGCQNGAQAQLSRNVVDDHAVSAGYWSYTLMEK
jgi:hypothetical protein